MPRVKRCRESAPLGHQADPSRLPMLARAAARVLLPRSEARWRASGHGHTGPPSPPAPPLVRVAPQHAGATFAAVICACARDAMPPPSRALRATSWRCPRPARRHSPRLPRRALALARGSRQHARSRAARVAGSATHSSWGSAPRGALPHTPPLAAVGARGEHLLRASLGRCRGAQPPRGRPAYAARYDPHGAARQSHRRKSGIDINLRTD